MQITLGEIIAIVTEIAALIGVLIPVFRTIRKMSATVKLISDGARCQLRSDMLQTYYEKKQSKLIEEYEIENFIKTYNAYKALGGNSFIDRVYDEVMEWEVKR